MAARTQALGWSVRILSAGGLAAALAGLGRGEAAPARKPAPKPAAPAAAAPLRPDAPAPGPRRLALLVSVSNYTARHPSRKVLGEWQNLNCFLDTRNLRQTLIAPRYGFADGDVLLLEDLKATRGGRPEPGLAATRAGILDGFRKHLIAQARPGDVVVFLYSGHGNQIKDQPAGQPGGGDEEDGYDEAFVPYDYAGTPEGDARAYVRDDDLQGLLRDLKAKMTGADGRVQGSINLIIDSCHSGTVTRGIRRAKGKGIEINAKGNPIEINAKGSAGSALNDEPGSGYVLMSACQSNESAFEATDEQDRPLGGALAYNLCRVLREAPGSLTYRELFDRVRVSVKAAFFNQNPVVEGEVDRVLFGGVAARLPSFPRVESQTGNRLTLSAGRLLGVTVGSRYSIHPSDADAAAGQKALAEVEITAAETYSAVGVLRTPAGSAPRPVARLLGLPAALKSMPLGDGRLRVQLDEVPQLAEALRAAAGPAAADPVQIMAAGAPLRYDFRVTRRPPGRTPEPGRLYLVRDDDTVAAVVPDDAQSAAQLRLALVRQWRWRTLTGLEGSDPALRVDLRLIPVDVPLTREGAPDFPARRDRPTVERTPQGHVLLRDGDYFRLELEYRGDAKFVWVTVLGLQEDGRVQAVFPNPRAPVQEANRLGEDRRVAHPRGLYQVTAPFGFDLYKVIVTTQEVNFGPLVDAPENAETPAEAQERLERARALARGARGPVAPLARLLLNAGVGARNSSYVDVGHRDWATTTTILETRPR
jgi:hypothetical protein